MNGKGLVMSFPVIKGAAMCLAHVPSLVRYGSKPARELCPEGPFRLETFLEHLRSYDQAVAYAPHQVFVGNLVPDDLWRVDAPWFVHTLPAASPRGPWLLRHSILYELWRLALRSRDPRAVPVEVSLRETKTPGRLAGEGVLRAADVGGELQNTGVCVR